ncbi:hypothetical protein [Nocardia sp. NPDC050793]|uniref:hypothetical protein n=1 Tax=Nocardia sp. NPDC050793 TaxID=3155159 RepID=UPI0033F9B19B
MTAVLGEFGKKLAERWGAYLTVPGLLYLAAVVVAGILGQRHALEYSLVGHRITAWAGSSVLRSTGGLVLVLGVVLAASVAVALAAGALGRVVELIWVSSGRHRPARWLVNWRRKRSCRAKEIADDPISTPAQVRRAIARTDRICLLEPHRPTWIGDRLRVCEIRIHRTYGLDLNSAWPRLWLILPDTARTEIGTARDLFVAAAGLVGWSVLYVGLAVWWWPAALIAVITATAGVMKARLATTTLTDLVESAMDLYGADLFTRLEGPATGPITPARGAAVTTLMRKSRWDPQSPLAD